MRIKGFYILIILTVMVTFCYNESNFLIGFSKLTMHNPGQTFRKLFYLNELHKKVKLR
jgi:hypothetical protein